MTDHNELLARVDELFARADQVIERWDKGRAGWSRNDAVFARQLIIDLRAALAAQPEPDVARTILAKIMERASVLGGTLDVAGLVYLTDHECAYLAAVGSATPEEET